MDTPDIRTRDEDNFGMLEPDEVADADNELDRESTELAQLNERDIIVDPVESLTEHAARMRQLVNTIGKGPQITEAEHALISLAVCQYELIQYIIRFPIPERQPRLGSDHEHGNYSLAATLEVMLAHLASTGIHRPDECAHCNMVREAIAGGAS
jgi:hypothetical protein